MDEQIKPVAWIMPSALKALHRSEVAMVGPVNQGADEPLYSQQSIDALRAEVEVLKADAEDYVEAVKEMGARLVRHREALAAAEAEAEALRKDAARYRLLCELIDGGDQGADDAVGDAYALGAGALDLFLDEQPRVLSIDAARKGAE